MSHCEATLPSLERAASAARRRDDTDAAASATALWTAQRRSYRDLLRHKRESFWMAKVDAERSSPHQLWRSVDAVGPRPRPESQDIGAMAFHRFFEAKVAGVRASTADAPPPSFTPAPTGCEFRMFRPITTTDVIRAVKALPDKQCSSDPFQTRVLKSNIDMLAPFPTELFNRSLSAGAVPTALKAAYVTPLLKKSTDRQLIGPFQSA